MNSQNEKIYKNYGFLVKNKELVIKLFKEGNSAYRISQILDCGKSSVLRNLKEWGFQEELSKRNKTNKNNLLKDKTEQVLELFEQNKNCTDIAKIVGHSESSVWKLLRSLGKDTNRDTYKVDEDFFKVINTQEKAYVLGWIYSDGNIMPQGKFRITLHEKDREILEKIKEILKYEGVIYDFTKKQQVELCINRKSMIDDLAKLGCYPNKVMTLKLPGEDQVPEELFHHFLRGYFDGDGSLRVVNNSLKYVNVVGSYEFIYGLSEKLPFQHNIYQRYKDRPQHLSSHQMFFNRQTESKAFLNYIYKDANIYLQRKFLLAQPFLLV